MLLYLTGKNFKLDSNPIQAILTQSVDAVQLGGVQIGKLDPGEGNKSFIMEITEVMFLEKQDQGLNNYLLIHRILSQIEVVIVNDDGMLYIYTYIYVYEIKFFKNNSVK